MDSLFLSLNGNGNKVYSSISIEYRKHNWNMHSTINLDLYILLRHKRELLPQIQTWKFTWMFHLLHSFDSQHFPKTHRAWVLELSQELFILIHYSNYLFDLQSSSYIYIYKLKTLLWEAISLTLNTLITIYLETYLQKFNWIALYMKYVTHLKIRNWFFFHALTSSN